VVDRPIDQLSGGLRKVIFGHVHWWLRCHDPPSLNLVLFGNGYAAGPIRPVRNRKDSADNSER
jgi:hypothetical protein